MKIKTVWVFAGLLFLFTVGCSSSNEDAVLLDGPREELKLSVEEVKTVKLEENRTTGFEWHYDIKDENVVEIVSDEYHEPQTDALGAGGERLIELKGASEGLTEIEFEYSREWEEGEADESILLEVTVK